MRVGIMLRDLGEKGGIVTYTKNLVKSFLRLAPQHHFALLYASAEPLSSHRGSTISEHLLPAAGKFAWDHWAVPRQTQEIFEQILH